VHQQSGHGISQPQRMPYYSINPAIQRYSNEKLEEGSVKEHIEHPSFSMGQARMIARDHLVHNPRAYGKCGGKSSGIHLKYSPVNQAYFVMWHNQVLRIINDKKEAEEYVKEIGGKCLPSDLKYGTAPDRQFNKAALKAGIKVETEHTNSRKVAKAIAKAHLKEMPDYYKKLKKMEKGGKLNRKEVKELYSLMSKRQKSIEESQRLEELDKNQSWKQNYNLIKKLKNDKEFWFNKGGKNSPNTYYIIDMANAKRYFSTRKEADRYRKYVHGNTAIWLNLYKTKKSKLLKEVKGTNSDGSANYMYVEKGGKLKVGDYVKTTHTIIPRRGKIAEIKGKFAMLEPYYISSSNYREAYLHQDIVPLRSLRKTK
jgi:hypothetical protein